MNAIRPFLAHVCALVLTALCGSCSQMMTIPSEVDPAKASDMMGMNRKNPDFIIIDVRTPGEYEKAHIPGAININFQSSESRTEIKQLDRNKTYLLYCRSGNRCAQAMETMREMGFTHVAHITGGITAWQRASLRTISGPEPGK